MIIFPVLSRRTPPLPPHQPLHDTGPVPGVVEEAAVPQGVHAPRRRVEEARVGAVEAVQAVLRVLGGVAVHHVQQHHDAHGVGHVDQLLQLVGGPVATGKRDILDSSKWNTLTVLFSS